MKYLLENFKFTPGNHCFYSSLYNIFNYMGIRIKEHELFFLCNGLSFEISLQKNSEFFDNILNAIEIDYINQIKILCKRTGIKQTVFYNFDDIYDLLSKGKPVLAFLKSEALKYNIVQNPRENLGAHGLTIYGIDSKENVVHVADSYVLDYENNVNTFDAQLYINDLKKNIIGFCSFDISNCFVTADTVNRSCLESIERYLDIQLDNGEEAVLYIIHHLDILNKGKNITQTNQNNYITLIYLLKAYFLNILSYIQELADNRQKSSMIYSLNKKITVNLNAFFLRCLSNIGKETENDYRTTNSGEAAIKLYSELLKQLKGILSN